MLIKTKEEYRQFIAVNKAFNFDNVAMHIEQVERKYIKPLLGTALYNKVVADYNLPSSDPKHLDLLKMCRYPIVELSFLKAVPKNNVQISDAGIRVATGEDKAFRPASRWQIEDLKNSTLYSGFEYLEALLEFLEEKQADYPDWDYANQHQYFLNTARQFNGFCDIQESRLIFIRMRAEMIRVEKIVKSRIGKEQFDDFKTILADQNTAIPAEQEDAVEYIRSAIANLTFANAIKSLPVSIEGGTISIFNNQFLSDFEPKMAPDKDVLSWMRRRHRENGEEALTKAVKFIEENLDDFPLYRDNTYIAPEDLSELEDPNDGSGFFMP